LNFRRYKIYTQLRATEYDYFSGRFDGFRCARRQIPVPVGRRDPIAFGHSQNGLT